MKSIAREQILNSQYPIQIGQIGFQSVQKALAFLASDWPKVHVPYGQYFF
jgi:hypothetical protein